MRVSQDEIKKALIKNKGLIAPSARNLGISRQALDKRVKKNKVLKEIRRQAREELKDFGESILIKLMQQEDFRAVKYFLATQAKDRGYVERQETKELSDKKPQIFKFGERVIEF
jgi:deoxycytidine triphosphate deaminase